MSGKCLSSLHLLVSPARSRDHQLCLNMGHVPSRRTHEPSCLVTGWTCRPGVHFWELNKVFALAVFTSLVHTGSRCPHAQEPWEIVSERDLHTAFLTYPGRHSTVMGKKGLTPSHCL